MPQIHFNLVALSAPNNHVQTGWAHPADRQGEGLMSPEYWGGIARTLERGRFDGIFFADTLSAGTVDPEGIAEGSAPRPDPLMLVTLLSQMTTFLGFAVTLTTVVRHPFWPCAGWAPSTTYRAGGWPGTLSRATWRAISRR
jgi:hypothetical protein